MTSPHRPDHPPERLPPQATMGLLDYVTAHALDEDYGPRREPGPDHRRRPRRGWRAGVVLAVFALLLVVAGAQTSRGATTEADERADLAGQLVALRDRVVAERQRVRDLEQETGRLAEQELRSDASTTGLQQRVRRLGGASGLRAVQGPGVRVVADDAVGSDSDRTRVLDSDLQRLVNGWWAAGAEAIAVNGQRLTARSAIRVAGSAITVNNRSLRAPYRLDVVGDPDTLPARFAESASGQAWLDLQRQVGLRLSIEQAEALVLPAASPTVRYAVPLDGAGEEQEGGTS